MLKACLLKSIWLQNKDFHYKNKKVLSVNTAYVTRRINSSPIVTNKWNSVLTHIRTLAERDTATRYSKYFSLPSKLHLYQCIACWPVG